MGEVRPFCHVDRDLSIKCGQQPTYVEVPLKYLVIAVYWVYRHSDASCLVIAVYWVYRHSDTSCLVIAVYWVYRHSDTSCLVILY